MKNPNTLGKAAAFLALLILSASCMSQRQAAKGPPPVDPITNVAADELRTSGLAFGRRGDLIRAQQYLSAALEKGYEETVVVPELVKVCIASSRLRAALSFAEPYLAHNPGDAGMQYVVATIHMALGNLREALKRLDGALRADELMTDARYSMAVVAFRQGDLPSARMRLEEYLRFAPKGRYAPHARTMLVSLGGES